MAACDHFTEVRPTEPMDPQELLVTIGAEAYDLCGRSLGGRSGELARAAQAAAPGVPMTTTRAREALEVGAHLDVLHKRTLYGNLH